MGCIRRGLVAATLQRNRKNESWTIQSCYGSFIWDPSGIQKALLEYRTHPCSEPSRTELGNLNAAAAENKLLIIKVIIKRSQFSHQLRMLTKSCIWISCSEELWECVGGRRYHLWLPLPFSTNNCSSNGAHAGPGAAQLSLPAAANNEGRISQPAAFTPARYTVKTSTCKGGSKGQWGAEVQMRSWTYRIGSTRPDLQPGWWFD